jgi:hypothetical protein
MSWMKREELLDTFRGLVIGGRWLQVAAESIVSLLLLTSERLDTLAGGALLLLGAYNALSLAVVHRIPVRRVPIIGLLSLDLLFVGIASLETGSSQSPFLGQFYLIIFAAALFYGFAGGAVVGAVSALITTILAIVRPAGLWEDVRDLVPYFLVTGAYTGYLVARVRAWFTQYQESAARERDREIQAEAGRRDLELARSIQAAALPAAPPFTPD